MRYLTAAGLAAMVALASLGVGAQEPPPAPSPEEAALIKAVLALQKAASAECDALPSVKQYAAVLSEANAAFAKSGRKVDWRTGAVSAVPKGGAK